MKINTNNNRANLYMELESIDLVDRLRPLLGKGGIEKRPTVEGLYGAYFYTRSRDEGLDRWQQARDLVDKHLGPNVPVILKRYCTEFELGPKAKGPSDKVPDITQEEKEWELFVESHFPDVVMNTEQPKIVVANVMRRWIRHAFENGDQTYRLFTGGKPLGGKYVTYHPEEQYARPSGK